jgi:hypothetical protein
MCVYVCVCVCVCVPYHLDIGFGARHAISCLRKYRFIQCRRLTWLIGDKRLLNKVLRNRTGESGFNLCQSLQKKNNNNVYSTSTSACVNAWVGGWVAVDVRECVCG